jgi:hypothetical protein
MLITQFTKIRPSDSFHSVISAFPELNPDLLLKKKFEGVLRVHGTVIFYDLALAKHTKGGVVSDTHSTDLLTCGL